MIRGTWQVLDIGESSEIGGTKRLEQKVVVAGSPPSLPERIRYSQLLAVTTRSCESRLKNTIKIGSRETHLKNKSTWAFFFFFFYVFFESMFLLYLKYILKCSKETSVVAFKVCFSNFVCEEMKQGPYHIIKIPLWLK